jgi:tetratricopeptide (TPR) repeat protein
MARPRYSLSSVMDVRNRTRQEAEQNVTAGYSVAEPLDEDWLRGRASLGAAAKWTTDEMRVVAELGFALAEQGRNDEAITVFEGLAALAPSTAYFQSALGALKLRTGHIEAALAHLDAAIDRDPANVSALTNRGEALMRAGRRSEAILDLQEVLRLSNGEPAGPFSVRARALLAQLDESE